MNLKLNDGTVRCLSCMDASSYACETDEACTYCGTTQRLAHFPAPVPPANHVVAYALDPITEGRKIHDLLVSCYTGTGEDGRPEDVHERRLSDGSCRCGYYA